MKEPAAVIVEAHEFSPRDFIAGEASLDFVNTVSGRDQAPTDWLDGYARLLEWAGHVQLLPERVLKQIAIHSQTEPVAAIRALTRAKALREEMFVTLAAMIGGQPPPNNSLALIRKHWIEGVAAHELRYDEGRVIPRLRQDVADFDLISALVAQRMVEHVLQVPRDRLRLCHGTNCSWLFIDSSKAGRRRWCDMAVCGNTAKSQRFYARSRKRRGAHT